MFYLLQTLIKYLYKICLFFCCILCFHYNSQAQTFKELNNEFIQLYDSGKYEAAANVGEKALLQCEIEFGTNHENYAISLLNLGETYTILNNFNKAIFYLKKSAVVYTKLFNTSEVDDVALIQNKIGIVYYNFNYIDSAILYYNKSYHYFIKDKHKNYQNIFTISSNLALCYIANANYIKLLVLAKEVLPIIAKEKGTQNEDYYSMSYYKSFALLYSNYLAEAAASYQQTLALAEKLFGKNNLEYVAILNDYYDVLISLNQQDNAEKVLLECIHLHEGLAQKDTTRLCVTYEKAGTFYSDKGFFVKAAYYYQKGLTILENAGLHTTDIYYTTLQSFAYCNVQSGKLLNAKKILENLINIYIEKYGIENQKNGELLIVLANTEAQLNLLFAAETHAIEGSRLVIKFFDSSNYVLINAKEVLGLVYNKMGNSHKSIEFFKEGIRLSNIFWGEESRQTASLQSNLGITYFEMGNYADAEIVLTKSLNTRQKILGNKHPEYALSLINLSMIHVFQARYEEANNMLLLALNIFIERNLLNTNNFITLINNIALLAEKNELSNEAKKMYLQLLAIMDKNEEKNAASYSLVFSNLSVLYFNEKNYDSVILCSTKAIDYLVNDNKVNTKEYIKAQNSLLLAYKNKGDYTKANDIAKSLLPHCLIVMGENAELTGIVYNNLAMLYLAQQNADKAAAYLDKGNNIILNNFRQNFYTLSEKEKLTWWDNQSFIFNLSPSLFHQFNITEGKWVEAMINRQIQLKGFILTDTKAAINKARNNKNPAIKKLLDDWVYHKNMLTKLYAQPIAVRAYNTDSLEQIVNSIEKQINQQTTNKIALSDAVYTWQDIQQKLQPNEIAIEYIKYPFYRNNIYSDSILYAAIIIAKNTHPKFIQLGTENKIAALMKGNATNSKEVNIHRLYRSRLVKKENTFPGEELCKIIWQPLKPYIQNRTIISFAPDGLLHKIAFNALPLSDDKILIDSFQMQQYSSIIQIADRKEKLKYQWQSAFLIGNVDYNNATQKNGSNITYTNTNNIAWSQLPGTNKELDDVKKLFSTNKIQTSALSKANATEEALKKLSHHSPNIIHIATHGFFLNQITQKTQSDISITGEQVISTSENPLLRSGIILAGANKAWSGEKLPENTEDGIVNAYEISQLDLSSTNLVVLSACETALGDIKGTEGVFGLQRAFKIAGVKNLIVSLWQVPDKETAELMHSFYTKLLQGNNIRTAFYAAQKEMREKYAPYSWAAFILIE